VFYQVAPWGWICACSGGVMGSDLHLDAFLPIVERYRGICGSRSGRAIEATCDPAGAERERARAPRDARRLLRDWYREHGERDLTASS
jgi:hypothetical protein